MYNQAKLHLKVMLSDILLDIKNDMVSDYLMTFLIISLRYEHFEILFHDNLCCINPCNARLTDRMF